MNIMKKLYIEDTNNLDNITVMHANYVSRPSLLLPEDISMSPQILFPIFRLNRLFCLTKHHICHTCRTILYGIKQAQKYMNN